MNIKNIVKIIGFIGMTIGSLNPIIAMEVSQNCVQEDEIKNIPKLSIYAVPPQGGFYYEDYSISYMQEAIGKDNVERVIPVEDPHILCADLGQSNCIKGIRKAVIENKLDNAIIYAQSQGGATALNYFAGEGRNSKIKALILEAPVVSGNSAIIHTLKAIGNDVSIFSSIARMPFVYYWMPYLSKLLFHRYWPAGKQPIKVINNIPTNVPIIIIHSEFDNQVPYHDSCALYYGLRAQGNTNAYLITTDGGHFGQIMRGSNEQSILQTILAKHKLIKNIEKKEANIDESQPDHNQYKKFYDELVRKERNHQRIGYGLIAGTTLLSCAVLYKIYQKFAA